MSNNPLFVLIVAQYHALLERYARRQLQHPHLAYSAVKEVFESLHEQGLLQFGPHLRSTLKIHTKNLCQQLDRSLLNAEKALAQIPTHPQENQIE